MSIWTASSMNSAASRAEGPWQWQTLQKGALCPRRSPRAPLYDLKAPTLPARLWLDALFTATIEAWWSPQQCPPEPRSWTHLLQARLLQLLAIQKWDFQKNIHTNKHQNAIVEEQLPFSGSLLGFFYFVFLMQWSRSVILFLFFFLPYYDMQSSCNIFTSFCSV